MDIYVKKFEFAYFLFSAWFSITILSYIYIYIYIYWFIRIAASNATTDDSQSIGRIQTHYILLLILYSKSSLTRDFYTIYWWFLIVAYFWGHPFNVTKYCSRLCECSPLERVTTHHDRRHQTHTHTHTHNNNNNNNNVNKAALILT